MAAVAVTLLIGKAKTWWLSFATSHGASCMIGVMTWDDFHTFLEGEFVDEDRERKLLSRFDNFVQKGDLATYISNFRTLRLELGGLVTDEAALWKFVGGLKYELKREVMRERSLITLSDATLAAERADAAERFARGGKFV